MVTRTGEDILMRQRYSVFSLRVRCYLLFEPIADIIRQIRGAHNFFLRSRLTPPILHREDKEQHIAIDKTISDTLELRFHRSSVGKTPIGIEVVIVVQTRTVIVVTIGRNKCHLVQCRTHRSFEPTLPLPFRIGLATRIHKVTREETELHILLIRHHCLRTTTRLLDILCILYMAIGHIDEREIFLVLILGYKLTYLTPVALRTYAPTIYRTRLQVSSLCLVTHVVKLRITRQAGSRTDIVFRTLGSLDRRIMQRSVRGLRI